MPQDPTKRNIEDEDWRLYNCQSIIAINNPWPGMKAQPGDTIKSVATLDLNGTEYLLGIPHASAVFLNVAYRCYHLSTELCDKAMASPEGRNYLPDETAFDCIESAMSTIVFSFTALEAFANGEIPDTYIHHEDREGILVPLSKPVIERNVGLATKLDVILPDIFGVKSPKGTTVWRNFVELRRLRDRIIHMKSADRHDRVSDKKSLWRSLFRHDLPCFPHTAMTMMEHFYVGADKVPRWFKKMPHKR